MPGWAVWIVVAVACVVIEIFTPSFFILWFGVGALVASLAAGLGAGITWQFTVFIATSAALIPSTKRISSQWLSRRKETKTNIYGIVGRTGYVTKDIGESCPGQVRVNGEVWTACSSSETKIASGTKVEVLEVKGVHLVVKALGEQVCE
ncbi:MAG TPA: NfeD family protein [Firmicutes bacterium]|nr:NfeD family protein [Candidatus Fermentithermobacillaceae bacterium]